MAVQAQTGIYLNFFGGSQYTRFANAEEYYRLYTYNQNDKISAVDTYRPWGGVDLYYNYDTAFGIQTGLIFSGCGSTYTGFLTDEANAKNPYPDTATFHNTSFNSHVYLNYLKIPLMFRFNTDLNQGERVNASMFAGFQLSYLTNVQAVTINPEAPAFLTTPPMDFYKLYSTFNFGWVAGAQINIRLDPRYSITVQFRYDRDFTDMENKDYYTQMTQEQYDALTRVRPTDYYFPVGIKKSAYPGKDDYATRRPTLNNNIGGSIGLAIRLDTQRRYRSRRSNQDPSL